MVNNVTGSLFADKGYISANLKEELAEQGIDFMGQRSNMKRQSISAWDRAMLSKQSSTNLRILLKLTIQSTVVVFRS